MSVRRRIIISLVAMISIVSLILLFFIIINTDRVQQSGNALIEDVDSNVRDEVEQELLTLSIKISNFVLALEGEIENNMRNAANAVYEADRLSGFSLTLEDLEQLRERTGMSDIYIGGADGIFTMSTEPGGAGVSLFDIWEGYRMLVTGEADFMTSDLSMKIETGEIFKFALIPRADGMGIIESALEAGAVETHLNIFIDANQGIRSMNLFDASLLTLTENCAPGLSPLFRKGSNATAQLISLRMYFDDYKNYSIVFDEENAQIYYPIFDGTRTRYVLFIDMDTTGYFVLKEHVSETMTGQVQQTSTFNTVSLIVVLAVLLIFTVIIILLINRVMVNYEEQNVRIEERRRTVMDNENLVRYHTIILLCVGVFFAIVQGIQYGLFAAIVIVAAVVSLSAFMFLTKRAIPLNVRTHIISNGSFFVAFGCSAAITSTPDMFGLFLACVIVGTLYFSKPVIIGMAITVNTTIVVCILLLRLGLPADFEFTTLWFFNNMAGLNCGIALLYAVSSIGKGFIDNITFKSRENEELLVKVKSQNDTIISGINYARNIQQNLLPPQRDMEEAFADCSVIWKPRDLVGGDIYWMKQFDKGTVLCVADCTGHGTPGALLTMLVVSALESMVWPSNCEDTAGTIWRLDQRLSGALHAGGSSAEGEVAAVRHGIADINNGCDIAVVFIAKDGSIRFSSSRIPMFACDGNIITRYKGQRLFVGEGRLKGRAEVKTVDIPAGRGSKFYIASDGLPDQVGGEHGRLFGYNALEHIALDNHGEELSVITAKIWEAFEQYRGDEARRDDFELVAFEP